MNHAAPLLPATHPPIHKRLRAWLWGVIEVVALWRAQGLGGLGHKPKKFSRSV